MNWSAFTTRTRTAALALLALVGLVLVAAVAGPLALGAHDRAEIRAADVRIAASTAALARLGTDLGAAKPPSEGGGIEAASPALAGGRIQELLTAAVQGAGGTLRSVELLTVKPAGAYTAIPVRITFAADAEVLRSFLHQVESAVPVLVVDRLDIDAQATSTETDTTWQGDVRVVADVVGWMRMAAAR